MNRVLAGAIGGAAGSIPMTAVMLSLFERLPPELRYPLPPREITEAIAERADAAHRLGERGLTWSSLAAHFGYGAVTGALYTALLRRRPRYALATGALYGLLVWMLSYLGWVPALRLLQPGTRHPAPRRRMMIAAHLVWGAVTALAAHRLAGDRPRAGYGADT